MENFDFSLSVQIMFGKDRIEELPSAIAPYGKRYFSPTAAAA